MAIWVIFGVFMLISFLISSQLKSKFREYSQSQLNRGLTGKEVAEKMLKENGIYDVKVVSVEGELNDHYDPTKRTVNLSPEVYNKSSVASAAVAAHECGHAVQHVNAYSFLQMRSALVPIVSVTSKWIQWVLLAGIILVHTFPYLLLTGIIIFALTTLFSFITLPVEFDASRRALVWLNSAGLTSHESHHKAQDALKWAALTYVVAALSSLATLIYYILIYTGGRRND
ncbi:MAG: zinc metallopeptidase [Bacteroidia bacterium]|nr:zinc metallopeptidase [Bacteroidia bacterium]